MRPLSKAALGGGIVSVATVGGLIAGGVFATTATLVITDPLAPKANADSLSRFDSCGALLRWYVDHAVKEVGPYGWNRPMMDAYDMADAAQPLASAPMLSAEKSATGSVGSSGTGTNTQEADVDEPDVAKTDGRRVIRLVDQRVLVISDVTGDAPRELGRVSLPIDAYGGELLLAGDHVLVSQAGGAWRGGGPMPLGGFVEGDGVATPKAMPMVADGTRVIDIDISDAAHPRIAHDDTYTGSEISMRLYGDVVRVVTSTPRPELAWVMPGQPGHRKISEEAATRHNRALVRASTIKDWLPGVMDNGAAEHTMRPLVDCTDVYHPAEWSGGETTGVTTYDVADPGDRQTVGITADGQTVYSSADRLYVASAQDDEPNAWRRMAGAVTGREPMPRVQDVETQLHAFALDGVRTTYVGSGHVAGSVRDRWSLDEHDGKLRVAWTRDGSGTITDSNGETRQHTRNGITILSERDGALVPTGQIGNLGIDENIQSVRWFDDLAVLVTFRQMDPLYTIDLSDQDHPREVGALKIPGFSGYLHPIGDNLLLGLGVNATSEGHNLGGQAAVFDIGDLADPRRVSTQGFGEQSSLPALDDPRGFTWLPDGRTGLTTVTSWTTDRARLVALHVSPSGALQARDLATDVGWNARTLPLEDGRVALVDDKALRIVDPSGQ
ncbi:MAG TPA: beta-propeller domain-containing protein [Marmoricola sp.]|nr:beta-propeller domain-containing protein [Marmoricola sp.]